MAELEPRIHLQIRNKTRAWIAHGDNVVTLPNGYIDTAWHIEGILHLPSMGGVTTRGPSHTNPMTVSTKPDPNDTTFTRLLVRMHGGFGFTSCGFIAAITGTTERFDDVANTQTARTAATARRSIAGYSINGFGFTSCGFIAAETGLTERFDDVVNTHTARNAATARNSPAGYSLGIGYIIKSFCNPTKFTSATCEPKTIKAISCRPPSRCCCCSCCLSICDIIKLLSRTEIDSYSRSTTRYS